MRKALFPVIPLVVLLLLAVATPTPAAGQGRGGPAAPPPGGDGPLDALTYRHIGPVGNRVSAVARSRPRA